ncbi:hypothetical protein [Amycolatopsis samaneae]|uniref:Uncharacterized protein n=1 Tax=Amycolatopsis samaneae TaxID=664691 RepID=A0ABW5GVC4_9PSEU
MTRFHTELDPDEQTIALARVRARQLGQRLATSLIDRQLYGELQQFLDDLAFRACDAMDGLAGVSQARLRRRLDLVLGLAGVSSVSDPDGTSS